MPYQANEARRHKFPKARYRVSNWREYDQALQERGSLTLWVTPAALEAWHAPATHMARKLEWVLLGSPVTFVTSA
jgi:hypothetical protein